MTGRWAVVLLAFATIAGACTSGGADGSAEPAVTERTDTETTASAPASMNSSTTAPAPSTSTTTSMVPPTATTVAPPPGPLLGIAVPRGRIETVEAIEAEAGTRFHLIRYFMRWEDDVSESDIPALQAGGRAIHLSVRPVRRDGEPIPWREIADAEDGSPLHDEMVAWADTVVALGPDLRFTFNHEPETVESAPNGGAIDFRAAWRRMVDLVRDRGGTETTMVWTVGREALTDPAGSPWYPGDDVVDVIGGDLYNWYTCQGTDRPWRSFAELLEPPIAFAQERGKPLAVPEFASAADPADDRRRAGWMDAAVATMIEIADDPSIDLDYVAWFDVTAPGGTNPDCRWTHTTDVETARAFMRMQRALIGN